MRNAIEAPRGCDFLVKDSETFFEFLNIHADPGRRRIYRGQSKWTHKLVPGIARYKTPDGHPYTEKNEDLLFRHFKDRARHYLEREYDDPSLWAIAQHYGLPTRLLDWSHNPLIAAYFATEHEGSSQEPEHAAIFVFDDYPEPVIDEAPFDIRVTKHKVFSPAHWDSRIVNQRGLFTVHPYPWKPMPDAWIKKIAIAHQYRRELRKFLNILGVNESVIYPGLEGTAKHVKWMKTNSW